MTTRECPVCDRPVRDCVICTFCTSGIVECLKQVPDLLVELQVNATRQSKTAPRTSGVGRSAETPLPYGQRASDALKQLTDVLVGWARVVQSNWRPPLVYTPPPTEPAAAAKYLLANINRLRQHPEAEKAYDHITKARDHAMEVIDRDSDLVPAGRCDAELDDGETCMEILYGDPERASVRCRCGAEHPMDSAWMLTAARDQELTAAEIGRITPGVTGAMVRGYAKRDLLHPVGERKLGPERTIPTYRVGDLLDLLTRQTKEAS